MGIARAHGEEDRRAPLPPGGSARNGDSDFKGLTHVFGGSGKLVERWAAPLSNLGIDPLM